MSKIDLSTMTSDQQVQAYAEYTFHCAGAGTSPNYHKRFKFSDIPPGDGSHVKDEKTRRFNNLRDLMRNRAMLQLLERKLAMDPGHCQDESW